MFIIVGWLILLPPGVGWDIMGYESEPLPYYPRLRNCSYYIMLNDEESPSTPQVHLPRTGTTISPSGSSLESAPPRRRFHRWGGRPHFTLWSPVISWCTLRWYEVRQLTLPKQPRGIPAPRPPHVSPSSPWYAFTTGDGTLTKTLESTPLPPSSHCHMWAPTVSPTYTSSPGPVPLLLSSPAPSQSLPTASAPSSGSGTLMPNCCYYIRFYNQGMGRPPSVGGPTHWYGTRPYLPRLLLSVS